MNKIKVSKFPSHSRQEFVVEGAAKSWRLQGQQISLRHLWPSDHLCLSNLSSKGTSGRFTGRLFSVVKGMSPFVSPADPPKCPLPVPSHPGLFSFIAGEKPEMEQGMGLNPSQCKAFLEEEGFAEVESKIPGLNLFGARNLGPIYCKN